MKVNLRMHRGTLTRMGGCILKPQTLSLGFTLEYDSLNVLEFRCRHTFTDPAELGELGDPLPAVVLKTALIALIN